MTTKILVGDCRDVLRTLPDQSVHCVVTSPPYFGLRDYGEAGQIGLEEDPAIYVATMVEVFREARRVLRDDGTLFLNLGDSYFGAGYLNNKNTGGATRAQGGKQKHTNGGARRAASQESSGSAFQNFTTVLKPKDLIGIPWRVAFALQADGWYLRSDIIWHKPNPMPESVTDRPTKAHEYLFLLSKSERYHYDAAAIAEPAVQAGRVRADKIGGNKGDDVHHSPGAVFTGGDKRNRRSVWEVATQPFAEAHFATFPPALIEPCILAGCPKGGTVLDPFGGAGTTGLVADSLGRDAILFELNRGYADMARRRIRASMGRAKMDVPEPADAGGLLGWRA